MTATKTTTLPRLASVPLACRWGVVTSRNSPPQGLHTEIMALLIGARVEDLKHSAKDKPWPTSNKTEADTAEGLLSDWHGRVSAMEHASLTRCPHRGVRSPPQYRAGTTQCHH